MNHSLNTGVGQPGAIHLDFFVCIFNILVTGEQTRHDTHANNPQAHHPSPYTFAPRKERNLVASNSPLDKSDTSSAVVGVVATLRVCFLSGYLLAACAYNNGAEMP